MSKTYTICPYCETTFRFHEEPQFDGSFLLTCPECNKMFGIIDTSEIQFDTTDINKDLPQTFPVEDLPFSSMLETE